MAPEVDVATDVNPVGVALAVVRQRADDIERDRCLPPEVVAALRRTGINRWLVPAALGGVEGPVTELMDLVERIAAVDGSAAWCAVIGAGSNVFAGYLPEAGARVVFADPDQGSATMFAPTGRLTRVTRDGTALRLNGRWPFASNCLHSTWIGLGCLEETPHGVDPAPRVAFVPVADLTIEHTWDSVGLRGTGSHHVSAHDVALDLDQSCRFTDRPWPQGALWRLPLHTALVPALASVPLGIARGALDEIARQVREGRDARRGQLADDPIALADYAAADARLRAARASLHDAVRRAQELAERGERAGRQLQAEIQLACLHACDVGVEVASVAHHFGGAAASYLGSPLLRALGDVQAARQHLLFAPKHRSELAKALAGLDITYPPFVT